MTFAAWYPWVKALHVAAVLVFAGGVLGVAVFLRAYAGTAGASTAQALAGALHRWDRAVTTPAMLVAWGLGLALAGPGHWFGAAWLSAKLVFVVALSALHGIQSGRLRRGSQGSPVASSTAAPLVVACLVVIAVLAVVKPF